MIYLKTFKLSNRKMKNYNIYPFNILKNKEPDIFVFDNITVLYGNNGSGKSTILNIIATHSPFMLGILNAKIYNLDTKEYEVQKWSELENVRYFYNFFKERKKQFE